MIRAGGRLRHSILEPDQKHPLILPQESQFTRLIIWDAHHRSLHGGTQLTLSYIRQQFWIVRGRQAVKSIIFKCVRCWRQRAHPTTQLMGDLPEARVCPRDIFFHTGVDYAGPVNIRCSPGRGIRSHKGYLVIFVCLATRGVHLEVASDYSTREFIEVYTRFVSSRDICNTLYSDCGTNFIGADRELRQLFNEASSQSAEIARLLANNGTEWKFNPPGAPHFGGLWEAAVKSVKFHLKRVIGESTLTFEEMTTLLTRIEVRLNSRPIQPLTDDPTSLDVITPGHLISGRNLSNIPEPSTLNTAVPPRTRWQMFRQMHEDFWRRWSSEYLHELQQRSKWQQKRENVKLNDLCLLSTNQSPPSKWSLARVIEVIPGADGLVRIVKLRTASSVLTRPIAKVCILPSQEN